MENSYSIYRFGHHNLRDNTDYQLFVSIPKELYITIHWLVLAFTLLYVNFHVA